MEIFYGNKSWGKKIMRWEMCLMETDDEWRKKEREVEIVMWKE